MEVYRKNFTIIAFQNTRGNSIYSTVKKFRKAAVRILAFVVLGSLLLVSVGFKLLPIVNGSSANSAGKSNDKTDISLLADSGLLSETGYTISFNNNFYTSSFSDSTDSVGREIAKAFGMDSTLVDSSASDSIATIDSTMIDSTARIANLTHQRRDGYSTKVRDKKKSSFYAYTSRISRTTELDSTGEYVIIKEQIGAFQPKESMKIKLEDYIAIQMKNKNRDIWEGIGYDYILDEGKDDLGQLMSDITNIEIPLPSSSFLSIFGPPKIQLKINGSVTIHGAWKSETTEGITASRLGNTRNEPDFSQQVQISVNGMIGDKLSINADWNTERTFEYENQLKIKYTGYEDEIVQSVEAGNVSLQTSSLVGGSEALFGVKAQFQMGPFSLTALASQKKGEVQEVNISGGSKSQEFSKHLYEYSENHYFVDVSYIPEFEELFATSNPAPSTEKQILDLEVWKTVRTQTQDEYERSVNAYIDLNAIPLDGEYPEALKDSTGDDISGEIVRNRRFKQLKEGVDYTYDQYAGFISFITSINKSDAIAVAYRTSEEKVGEFSVDIAENKNLVVLKLIKPENLSPSYAKAWQLQLRNIYPIGGRDIKKEGFELQLKYQVPGQEPVIELEGQELLKAFGLDQTNESGAVDPDGAFDFVPGSRILPQTGEIIFPKLKPFGREAFKEIFKSDELAEKYSYDELYTELSSEARKQTEKDKFIISGEYTASVTSVYQIGFNVVENSVEVYLGGNKLKEGMDYTVDYNIGQLTIRNDAALVPGANLRVTYEQNDLFQLASKTLIGLRGLYEFSKDTKLGFSYLNLNQKSLSDKVRIGEEPINNSIMGVDFETKHDLPFLTKALDNIVSTSTMSSFNLKGEFAYMNPDPNTKKSNIASDGNESIAYIDDFEGSKRIIPVGVNYGGWRDLSVPDSLLTGEKLTKEELMDFKGKSFWFNFTPSSTRVTDIWPQRQVSRNDQEVTVLEYVFNPAERGSYNRNPNLDNPESVWGGMMRPLSSSASNLDEEHIEYIEFWVSYVDQIPDSAKLIIDLGRISEDVIPNGKLDTEDKNFNGTLNKGEDTGIDGMSDAEEKAKYGNVDDPNNDNFKFISGSPGVEDYKNINNTQGNEQFTDIGLLPDTEDLNNSGHADMLNNYFRYEVSLDLANETNTFVVGKGGKNWYQIRVPLIDFKEKIGQAVFTDVSTIRFWMTGLQSRLHLRFVDINLVGNQWEKVVDGTRVTSEDEVLKVSTISVEENPGYKPPPGVKREKDRTNPDENVLKNEQALLLQIRGLEDGDYREIKKVMYKPLDVFSYSKMKFFIRPQDTSQTTADGSKVNISGSGMTELYFRFGTDKNNFYEYRRPLEYNSKPNTDGWSEIEVDFEELTAIKEQRNTPDTTLYQVDVDSKNKVGHKYGIKGRPALTGIKYFLIGIVNPDSTGGEGMKVYGDVWINELRVLGADDTPGWAYSFNTGLKVADIMDIRFNMKQTDPYFHTLSQQFGSRVDKKSWGLSTNVDVLKLIPVKLPGSNLSLNYSHNESIDKPLYKPGTDISVDKAAEASDNPDSLKQITHTLNVSDSYSLPSIKIKVPSEKWYVKHTINSLSFGFNYNKSYSRSPSTKVSKRWLWNADANYNLNFSKENYFYPANIPLIGDLIGIFKDYRNVKFYFSPSIINSKISAKRNHAYSLSRADNSKPNIQRDFTAQRSAGFNWKFTEGGFFNLSSDYNVSVSSSLMHLWVKDNIEREESEIWSDIFSGEFFGRDYNYQQTFSLKTNPKMPSLFNLNRYFTLNGGYSVSYNWRNNFQQEKVGKSAGYSNSINAGMQIKVKSIFAPLFKEDSNDKNSSQKSNNRGGRSRGRNKVVKNETDSPDSTVEKSDSLDLDEGPSKLSKLLNILKSSSRWILLDYDNIAFNFRQTNTKSGGGIAGTGSGFGNFWGIRQKDADGPSRLFMLGLDNDLGARVSGAALTDKFAQKNTFDFSTRRPLWEGATISLNWKVGWGYNKSTTMTTDTLTGEIMVSNVASSGNLDKSFLLLPLPFFDNTLKKVNTLYNPNAENSSDNLSNAFIEGLETMPFLSKMPMLKEVAKYVPRANWKINWTGLEKLAFFKNVADRVSLNHGYSSTFTEGWKLDQDGKKQVLSQKISYGFSPLVGLNFQFSEVWGGDLTSSFKYSTRTNYDLVLTSKTINEALTKDINLTASYRKSGFEIPLFGLSLKNNIEVSFSYTTGHNTIVLYKMGEDFTEKGEPKDGTIRTTMEPRVKYDMSSKVSLSFFYRRTSVEPKGASRIPPTTTNEAGLDVTIAIRD